MFADYPAGFITPQLAPVELKQLDKTIEQMELQKARKQAWDSLEGKIPGLLRLPPKPSAQL